MVKNLYIDVAREAAQKAEKIMMKYFDSQIAYERKSDNSPVTIADKEAELAIRETISKYFPSHSILGEEHPSKVGDSRYLWTVDPIDGTKNFLRKLPDFGTLIALFDGEELIAGLSNMPVIKETMYAEKGEGAFLNDTKVHVSEVPAIEDAFLVYGGIKRFKSEGRLNSLFSVAEKTMAHRGVGDCWMYHLLAQGKVDVLLEARVNVWDLAAGAIIISEAGGKVTDMHGGNINRKTTNIIATNAYLYDEVFRDITAK